MSGKNKKYNGFLMTEVIVGLSLLGLLLAGLALSLHGIAKFNRYQLIRQRCIAAAQAQLDSIAATGEPLSDKDIERLWPGLSVSFQKSPGAGQWTGMELLEVTASGKSFRKDVTIRLSRYVLRNETSGISLKKNTSVVHVIASAGEAISNDRDVKECTRSPRRFAPCHDNEKIFAGFSTEGM